jgi:hypothetical protein
MERPLPHAERKHQRVAVPEQRNQALEPNDDSGVARAGNRAADCLDLAKELRGQGLAAGAVVHAPNFRDEVVEVCVPAGDAFRRRGRQSRDPPELRIVAKTFETLVGRDARSAPVTIGQRSLERVEGSLLFSEEGVRRGDPILPLRRIEEAELDRPLPGRDRPAMIFSLGTSVSEHPPVRAVRGVFLRQLFEQRDRFLELHALEEPLRLDSESPVLER